MANLILPYLYKYQPIFKQEVTHYLNKMRDRYSHLPKEFNELLKYLSIYLEIKGKWFRPAIINLSFQLSTGKKYIKVTKTAIVLEILHRYILIHDDLIDQDLIRHGNPTIENLYIKLFRKRYSKQDIQFYAKGIALIAGDMVNTMAYELAATSPFSLKINISLIKAINQLFLETCAGWLLQNEQNHQSIDQVSLKDYFKGMQLVSAQYSIVWPLRFGQILAGKLNHQNWDPYLDKFGFHAGAAFQFTDDLLGMFGNKIVTGKPSGHDYREGKKTFLVLYAYKHADPADKHFIKTTLGTRVTAKDIKHVREIMINTKAVAYVKSEAKKHALKAKRALDKANCQSLTAKNTLADLADFLADRKY